MLLIYIEHKLFFNDPAHFSTVNIEKWVYDMAICRRITGGAE